MRKPERIVVEHRVVLAAAAAEWIADAIRSAVVERGQIHRMEGERRDAAARDDERMLPVQLALDGTSFVDREAGALLQTVPA